MVNNDMKTNPLISVIVPIYNVEAYLEKCIESILAQDYTPLEIILVNDGATDSSGEICDRYAKQYKNITALHKKNGGLSSARNAGMEIMQGEYVSFIDSDDHIAPDMISTLYADLSKNKADISCVSAYNVYPNKTIANSNLNSLLILSKQEALDCFLFNNYLTPCAWGKLYKRELWNNIKFPEGRLFEDQLTTYKVIDLAEKAVFNPSPKYFYLKREGSIGHSKFNEKTYDLYKAINEEYDFIVGKYPELKANMSVAKITWEIVFINMMIQADKHWHDKKLIKKSRKFAKDNILSVLKCPYINLTRKVQISLFAYVFDTYQKLYDMYKKMKRIS